MKTLLFATTLLFSFSTLAHEVCSYRFSDSLAVELVVNDRMGENKYGRISWDNINSCGREDGRWICTEVAPESWGVRFDDETPPDAEGVKAFDIAAIDLRSDLGSRYRRNSELGRFVREAQFETAVNPEPQLTLIWNGKSYKMDCSELPHD